MELEKTLKYLIIAGLFVVPVVPLIISYSLFFPFIVGKAFVFRILVEIVFAAWLLLIFLDKKYLPKISWIFLAIFSFIFIITLADIFGVDPYRSFWSNFERMEGLITLLHLGAFFLVLGSMFDEALWKKFFHISLLVSVIVSFYALLQVFGKIEIHQGGVRVDGTMGNAIYLALYLLFNIFIALFYFLKEERNKFKIVYSVIIALELLIIYFTASRGVTIGLVFGFLVTFFLIAILGRDKKTLKRNAVIALLAIILLGTGFWAIKDSNFVKRSPTLSRFSDLSVAEIQTQGRYFIWPMAWKGFKERPILGYGQENFIYVFSKHYDPRAYSQEPWFDRVHNTFLDWLIAGGILGLLTYVFVLFSVFYALWRSNSSFVEKSVLTGLLSAYTFQSILVFDNLTSYIMLFSFVAYIWHLEPAKIKFDLPFSLSQKSVRNLLLPAVAVVFVALVYFSGVKPLRANRLLLSAIQPSVSAENSLANFEKVFELNTFGRVESLFQLMNITRKIYNHPEAPTLLKESYFNLTQSETRLTAEKFPEDPRLHLISGSFYSVLGDLFGTQSDFEQASFLYGESLAYLEKAKELSPSKQDIYYEIGAVQFAQSKTEEAEEAFKFAFELEPKNIESRIRYGLFLIFDGKVNEAITLLDGADDQSYFDNRIINALIGANQYEKVLEAWKLKVEREPQNITYRQSLVATYLTLENWDKAIEEINKIIEIEPSFKDNGEFAIGEIKAGRGSTLITN